MPKYSINLSQDLISLSVIWEKQYSSQRVNVRIKCTHTCKDFTLSQGMWLVLFNISCYSIVDAVVKKRE